MRKGILLAGAMLLAIASPLYADISSKNDAVLSRPTTAVCPSFAVNSGGQIADPLPADTQGFSILDTDPFADAVTREVAHSSSVALAPQTINPSAPVPEPVHYALMGLGLVGLYLARRDRLSAK